MPARLVVPGVLLPNNAEHNHVGTSATAAFVAVSFVHLPGGALADHNADRWRRVVVVVVAITGALQRSCLHCSTPS